MKAVDLRSQSELPVVEGGRNDYEVPRYTVHLSAVDSGDVEEGECPACLNRQVYLCARGETRDYRCPCGQILRIMGR